VERPNGWPLKRGLHLMQLTGATAGENTSAESLLHGSNGRAPQDRHSFWGVAMRRHDASRPCCDQRLICRTVTPKCSAACCLVKNL
jgi:hypothetical protein